MSGWGQGFLKRALAFSICSQMEEGGLVCEGCRQFILPGESPRPGGPGWRACRLYQAASFSQSGQMGLLANFARFSENNSVQLRAPPLASFYDALVSVGNCLLLESLYVPSLSVSCPTILPWLFQSMMFNKNLAYELFQISED